MMYKRLSLILLLLFSHALPADDVYKYVDKNGTTVYTNKPAQGSTKVALPPISVYTAPMTKNDYTAKAYTAPALPAKKGNPTISKRQNIGTNEKGRKQLLTHELEQEKIALQDAKQALLTGRSIKLDSEKNNSAQYQLRMQALQDAVIEHQKNIDILSRQLGINQFSGN